MDNMQSKRPKSMQSIKPLPSGLRELLKGVRMVVKTIRDG